MQVWRICRASDSDKLSGIGGLYVSGRWHHRGTRILYTSSTPSLAAMELLVHLDPTQAPAGLSLLEVNVPDDLVIEICDAPKLIANWQDFPFPKELQDFGSNWLMECRTAILSVPSAVMSMEVNYLINPEHKDSSRIRVTHEYPFAYDHRLITK